MKKAFTLIELVVAVAILAMVLSFAGMIFKVSIGAYRTAMANTEIMQKLRVITDQLNTDFKGLQKDGYLILHSEVQIDRKEYQNSDPCNFRADRLYYFSTGDFQSWFDSNIRSNIARIYFGHDSISLYSAIDKPVSKWNLARDIMLLTWGQSGIDYNSTSYAQFKANLSSAMVDANNLFDFGVPIDIQSNQDIRRLICQNVGMMQIKWTDGTILDGRLIWFGLSLPNGNLYIEDVTGLPIYYRAFWIPLTQQQYWPKALKFIFTLYDSKGTLKGGRTFTHIVYLGD